MYIDVWDDWSAWQTLSGRQSAPSTPWFDADYRDSLCGCSLHWYTKMASLYVIRSGARSQWRRWSSGVMWSYRQSVKRGSSCGYWHPEVWPQPDATGGLVHAELHWLDVPERVKYKVSMITHRCLNGTALILSRPSGGALTQPWFRGPWHCIPVCATASVQHLRFAASHQLTVPSYRLSSYGRRAFCVARPMMCKWLPRQLRDPVHITSIFGRLVMIFFFSEYWCIQCIGAVLALMRYIILYYWCFTCLLVGLTLVLVTLVLSCTAFGRKLRIFPIPLSLR